MVSCVWCRGVSVPGPWLRPRSGCHRSCSPSARPRSNRPGRHWERRCSVHARRSPLLAGNHGVCSTSNDSIRAEAGLAGPTTPGRRAQGRWYALETDHDRTPQLLGQLSARREDNHGCATMAGNRVLLSATMDDEVLLSVPPVLSLLAQCPDSCSRPLRRAEGVLALLLRRNFSRQV